MVLGSASPAQIARLDQLLSELAQLKTEEEVGKMEGSTSETKGDATWGTSVAGVCVHIPLHK